MTDWRSEPPDSEGDWWWRYERGRPVLRFEIVIRGQPLIVRRVSPHHAPCTWYPAPHFGQWLRVPE